MDLALFETALAATQTLASESTQLLRELPHALLHRLEVTPLGGDAPEPAFVVSRDAVLPLPPVLSLCLYPQSSYWATPSRLEDADIRELLQWFAVLIAHFQRLAASPELKHRFWSELLQLTASHRPPARAFPHGGTKRSYHAKLPVNVVSQRAFPRFAVNCSAAGSFWTEPLSDAIGDALLAFLTTSVERASVDDRDDSDDQASAHQTRTQQTETPLQLHKPSMSLSFANCDLTLARLETIERCLDRAVAHPDCQFALETLDVSHNNRLGAAELRALTRIASKCAREYGVSELKLMSYTPRPAVYTVGQEPPPKAPLELAELARVAFGMDTDALPVLLDDDTVRLNGNDDNALPAPATATAQSTLSVRSSQTPLDMSLCRVSLDSAHMTPAFYAAHFSALRYVCAVREDTSAYVSSDAASCRWRAFGLFYPRPARFMAQNRLETLSRLILDGESLAMTVETLRDPVTELVYGGDRRAAAAALARQPSPGDVMVCVVKQHARVAVFEGGAPLATPLSGTRTMTLPARTELEMLGERADGCACVVVPGVGLGWVAPEDVERVERESLEHSRVQLVGRLHLEFQCYVTTPAQSLVLRDFLALVGPQIASLTLRPPYDQDGSHVRSVLAHCSRLERLEIKTMNATDVPLLIDALQDGDLGRHLQSLNLNDSTSVSATDVEQLLALVSRRTDPLPLRELRLRSCALTAGSLTRVHTALDANRTLEVLELFGETLTAEWAADRDRVLLARKCLDAAHQGRVLQTALSLRARLAFASAAARGVRTDTALSRLEPWQLAAIVAFAGTREVRRVVLWTA